MSTPTAPEARLKALGLVLPTPSVPSANYVPFRQHNGVLYIAGQISVVPGGESVIGKLGEDLDIEAGYRGARIACLNAIAQLSAATGGDLTRIAGILKLSGFVRSTPEFGSQPAVMNGASDLLVEVFGDSGRHARFAIGVAALPRGVAVELDLIAALA
jgi:enamine deaminase RidA (YjgF/YER057c/UK114 family)